MFMLKYPKADGTDRTPEPTGDEAIAELMEAVRHQQAARDRLISSEDPAADSDD